MLSIKYIFWCQKILDEGLGQWEKNAFSNILSISTFLLDQRLYKLQFWPFIRPYISLRYPFQFSEPEGNEEVIWKVTGLRSCPATVTKESWISRGETARQREKHTMKSWLVSDLRDEKHMESQPHYLPLKKEWTKYWF